MYKNQFIQQLTAALHIKNANTIKRWYYAAWHCL